MADGTSAKGVVLHAAVEAVVIAGVAFWLARRLSLAEERIFLLEERLAQTPPNEGGGAEVRHALQRHEAILQRLLRAGVEPPAPPASRPSPRPTPRLRATPRAAPRDTARVVRPKRRRPRPAPAPAPLPEARDDLGVQTDDDVEDYLRAELDEIRQNRVAASQL